MTRAMKPEQRAELEASIDAGEVSLVNGWVVVAVDRCTCAGFGPDGMAAHEPGCGTEPLARLIDLLDPDEFDEPTRAQLVERLQAMAAAERETRSAAVHRAVAYETAAELVAGGKAL